MDDIGKDDILLADEEFDFDLSLSSSSANEDDEVFFGPIGHKERCIAASLELNNQIPKEPLVPASESHFSWSPLTGEKFVEVYKEAHLLALQIESNSKTEAAAATRPEAPWSQGVERFIQESKLKISLFEKENAMRRSPTSLKRETYHLSDSPSCGPQLSGAQPASGAALRIAPALARASPALTPRPPRSSHSPLPVEPGTAYPAKRAVTQKRVTSKLLPPRASSVRGKAAPLAMEKPTKEIPAGPSRVKTLSEKESQRDRPPDRPSAAQDVASLPASGSHLVEGKRSRPVPNKLGLKKTLLKPPGCAGFVRRKPSSSGSVPGVAPSVSASPAAGKTSSRPTLRLRPARRAKSSEPANTPADSSRPRSNTSQSGRTGYARPGQSVQAGPAGVSCRQSKWAGLAELTTEQAQGPTTAPLTQPQTPQKGALRLSSHSRLSHSSQRDAAGSIRRRDSYLNAKTEAMPTPTSQFKIPISSTGEPPDGGTPKFSQAQRPQSCTLVGRVVPGTPARRSSGPAPQSLSSNTRTPVSMRRRSAWPTPASRRLSLLPLLTPRTMPKAPVSPSCVPVRRLSSEPQKKSAVRTVPVRETSSKAASGRSGLSPDASFSPSSVPQALNFSPEKSDFPFSKSITTKVALDEAQPPEDSSPAEGILVDVKLDQLTITSEANSTPLLDLPLIDFCNTPEANVAVASESRPLIDLLINTPDLNREAPPKPLPEVGQLIDLASPLIQLSPEADKENVDSPLLKF
ncbi:hypothetical protein MC885_008380 [Smutsia gigantea]|nr:hypothetical protein MC885_008380 [Smutsia gigantea]